jgi:hypothetical protein
VGNVEWFKIYSHVEPVSCVRSALQIIGFYCLALEMRNEILPRVMNEQRWRSSLYKDIKRNGQTRQCKTRLMSLITWRIIQCRLSKFLTIDVGSVGQQTNTQTNSVALVRKRTIPTELLPLVCEVIATFAARWCYVVSATDPHGRILGFLDWSLYYFFQVAPQLYSRGWVDPVPDPLLLRKSDSAGNRTRDLCICSQEPWPLDHRRGILHGTTHRNASKHP